MSKSLLLSDGDLSISNRSYKIIKGKDKLFQDLSLWILEKIGTDPSTPDFGSDIESNYIGEIITDQVVAEIESELIGLINRYQQLQLQKIKDEVNTLGQTTLDQDEIIEDILSFNTRVLGTTIVVEAVLLTLGNSTVKIVLPVGTV